MKKIIIAVCFAMFTASAWAQTLIDERTVKNFIKAFPEYEQYCIDKGESVDSQNMDVSIAFKYKAEIDSLLAKYGLTFEEFTSLVPRVSMGYAAILMEKQGMNPRMMSGMNGQTLSDNELGVLKGHTSELGQIFHNEG
ncbi:MAG: hypothetical protein HQL30_04350 [Candidatus Omnitrophica bacterium]|nr:hypothetical protein [Candidatus Omnitrophota bacterium]